MKSIQAYVYYDRPIVYDLVRIYRGSTRNTPYTVSSECRRRQTITDDYSRFAHFSLTSVGYYDFSRWTYEQSRLCTIPYDSRRLGIRGSRDQRRYLV